MQNTSTSRSTDFRRQKTITSKTPLTLYGRGFCASGRTPTTTGSPAGPQSNQNVWVLPPISRNVAQTLTQLRSKFWICHGRQYVRKVLHSCRLCRLIEGQPYSGPQSPLLCAFRTTIGRPSEHTGVDFAGPFYVKCDQTMEKAYLVLYTCAVTRRVHLDLV